MSASFRESDPILQIILAAFLQVGAKWPASEDKNLEGVNMKFHFDEWLISILPVIWVSQHLEKPAWQITHRERNFKASQELWGTEEPTELFHLIGTIRLHWMITWKNAWVWNICCVLAMWQSLDSALWMGRFWGVARQYKGVLDRP